MTGIAGLITTKDSVHCRIGTTDVCEEISGPRDNQNKREYEDVLGLHLKKAPVRRAGGSWFLWRLAAGIKRAKFTANIADERRGRSDLATEQTNLT